MDRSDLIYYLILYGIIFLIKYLLSRYKVQWPDSYSPKNPPYYYLGLDFLWATAGFALAVMYYYQEQDTSYGVGVVFLVFAGACTFVGIVEGMKHKDTEALRLRVHLFVMVLCVLFVSSFFLTLPTHREYQVAIPYFDKSMGGLNNSFVTQRLQFYSVSTNAKSKDEAQAIAIEALLRKDDLIYNNSSFESARNAFDIRTDKILVVEGKIVDIDDDAPN